MTVTHSLQPRAPEPPPLRTPTLVETPAADPRREIRAASPSETLN